MNESLEKALAYLGAGSTGAVFIGREVSTGSVVSRQVTLRTPRLPSSAVARLAERLAVAEGAVLSVMAISRRTYLRRQTRQESLTDAESDRLLRIARVAAEAERVFGDSAKAKRWLTKGNCRLGSKPFNLLGYDAGSREVEMELCRIDFGDFA